MQAGVLREVARGEPSSGEAGDSLAGGPRPRRLLGMQQLIGAELPPTGVMDLLEMNRRLDVVQFNHDHPLDQLASAAFWFDRVRPLKGRPFWCTRTAATWTGDVQAGGALPPRGFCRVNSWLPIALGGEANLYGPWRAHWAGPELMHGSVITSDARPGPAFEEIQEISSGFYAAAEFLRNTTVEPARIALHAAHHAWATFQAQPMIAGFDYYDALIRSIYTPLIEAQFRLDVIEPAADLTPYRVVVSPFLPSLDAGELRERLAAWIHAGGTWIAGPLTDIRTRHGTRFTHSPFGSIEEWGGVHLKLSLPGVGGPEILWRDGTLSPAGVWLDGFEPRGAETLATHEGERLKGLAAVTSHRMGQGRVIVLGCLPGGLHWQRLVINAARAAAIAPGIDADPNLLVVPREGDGVGGMIVVELRNKPGSVRLRRKKVDLLSSRRWSGRLDVEPFGVHVLQWDE
ncbi:MAG: Beta-galactosidase YesZ [candidate division BRC1 bacterium ADurb.BinA292]|nr:MAG: Beta-galactosidase YesZ [candidate division BRC1 bacterium ADurb.BinA292]